MYCGSPQSDAVDAVGSWLTDAAAMGDRSGGGLLKNDGSGHDCTVNLNMRIVECVERGCLCGFVGWC